MEFKNYILEELKEISADIVHIGNHNVYTVPENYFQNFPSLVLDKVYENSAIEKNLSAPFSVPAGYFDDFAKNILNTVKASEKQINNEVFNELQETAPLLNTISKANIYTVPLNYFESFSPTLSRSAPAKVIQLSSSRKWFRYAAAAVVTGIIVGGSYFFLNDKTNDLNTAHYTSSVNLNVSENISKLSDAELTSYLNQSADDDIFSSPPSSNDDSGSVQDDINVSSDEEIQQYLQENKAPGDKMIKGI